ncbi:Cell cycle checkpoint control protein RAD9B [Oryzias melastigma]|uniref:Cell cycle checkpoint control protein RAD9B n=1 Tax=Oryzias melastigma TaxID=30732 RepID=A0A834C257_ORYME|nr:Cell cycle checkpoint control protein RAD9B [Oryzias melastigma]
MHFPLFQEEITLSTTPLRFSLRNYEDSSESQVKMMYTEMSLHPDEFEHFQVDVDSKITFCLKELRGFLSFTESHCLPVSVHFDSAGKPVCFSVEDLLFEATVVLATLTDPESTDSIQPAGTQVHATCSFSCFTFWLNTRMWNQLSDGMMNCRGILEPDQICALLFKAVSSEKDDGVCAATPPVLAGDTDDEEMMEELCPRSPSP